jgi:hypothetical protein
MGSSHLPKYRILIVIEQKIEEKCLLVLHFAVLPILNIANGGMAYR